MAPSNEAKIKTPAGSHPNNYPSVEASDRVSSGTISMISKPS